METDAQTDYFYDILQSLALIHSELVQIRQLLERNKGVQAKLDKDFTRFK